MRHLAAKALKASRKEENSEGFVSWEIVGHMRQECTRRHIEGETYFFLRELPFA